MVKAERFEAQVIARSPGPLSGARQGSRERGVQRMIELS